MMEIFKQYTGVDFSSGAVLTASILLFAVLVGVLLWWLIPLLKRKLANWRIGNQVKKLGDKMLSNVRLPDGIDGELFIDYLVLSGNKVIVIDVKRYDGLIYGGENLAVWTQVVNRRNYQFTNPLHQMRNNVVAVRAMIPDMEVEGAVLFAGRSYFPKRVPEGVLRLEDISGRAQKSIVSGSAMDSWLKLQVYK
jgi:hypothetical protein